jgi:hypothetical protein
LCLKNISYIAASQQARTPVVVRRHTLWDFLGLIADREFIYFYRLWYFCGTMKLNSLEIWTADRKILIVYCIWLPNTRACILRLNDGSSLIILHALGESWSLKVSKPHSHLSMTDPAHIVFQLNFHPAWISWLIFTWLFFFSAFHIACSVLTSDPLYKY